MGSSTRESGRREWPRGRDQGHHPGQPTAAQRCCGRARRPRLGRDLWTAWLFVAWVSLQPAAAAVAGAQEAGTPQPADIEFFMRHGCPHCAEAEHFLDALTKERPGLRIETRDVVGDPAARQRLQVLSSTLPAGSLGVPAFYVRDQFIVGFAGPGTTGARIRALLDRTPVTESSPWMVDAPSCSPEEVLPCDTAEAAEPGADAETIEIPLLHRRVAARDIGLPLFAAVIGLLDGFNPCSTWVLILMLSMLATLGNRRRMLLIAGTFVVVEGLAYFAFMAAWLNLFLFIGLSRTSEIVLGVIAGVAGIINVKDFWAFGQGVSLSIPATAKPTLYTRMRRILQAKQTIGAVAGAALLALLVQVIELLCTSGFPALYTRILTMRNLDSWSYYGYLLLYNVFYILNHIIILAIGVVTLSQRRLQEKEGRWLKMVSGLVMLGLAAYLIVKPS